MSEPEGNAGAVPLPAHPPFPGARLLYAIGFAFLAWFAFWAIIVLAAIQFVVVAINGRANEELKTFSANLVQYLWELLAYIVFARGAEPFPLGPFPKTQ
jgi:hypothetical protein